MKEFRSSVHYVKEHGLDGHYYSNRPRSRAVRPLFNFHDIIGIDNVKRTAQYLAGQRVNILITGETGTGKEMFASSMHNASMRCNESFIAVNCAALPRTLFESELFGYKRGAFTDARSDRIGRIEYAHKGTMFLDEIGEMPFDIQSKLLRVLETKTISPLGANEEKLVDVRFFFATNQDLQDLVRRKLFRPDLYYRLSSTMIHIPALREHKADIPDLVLMLLSKIRNEYDITNIRISDGAMKTLFGYDFPGNVRELEGLLRNACIKCMNGMIEAEDLGLDRHPEYSLSQQVQQFRMRIIEENYKWNNGDINKICSSLKISRRQVYRYLKLIKNHGDFRY